MRYNILLPVLLLFVSNYLIAQTQNADATFVNNLHTEDSYASTLSFENIPENQTTNLFVLDTSDKSLTVFPNPTSDYINVSSNIRILKIYIYNMEGKLVDIKNHQLKPMDVSKLAGGVYILSIFTNEGFFTRPFVKL